MSIFLLGKGRKEPEVIRHRDEPKPASPKRQARQAMYDYKWSLASKLYRQINPFCRQCQSQGIATASQCVDHIVPHKGDWELFWNEDNWQALCHRCHNKKSATEQEGERPS